MKDEDKTFENERKHMNEAVEDRGPDDLTLIIETYREDLKKYQDKESLYIRTENQLQGTKRIVIEMSGTIRELTNQNNTLQAEIARLNEDIQLLEMQIKK